MDLQKHTDNNNNNNFNFNSNMNNQNLALSDTDKLLVLASHLGGIFFGFIPALIAFLVRKDTPGFVLDNAREALNWQITVIIAMFVSGIFTLLLIGFLMIGAVWLCNIIFCIVATFKSSNKEFYRYPLCLRLIK